MKPVKIAISPCPNDTFMFDAIMHKKIDLYGLEFDFHFLDIQELNLGLLQNAFDVSKMSIAMLPEVVRDYILLDSGAALGRGNGPLLVGNKNVQVEELLNEPVLIPGKNTTANLLLSFAFAGFIDRKECLFSQIPAEIARGQASCGVIIHESRFTFQEMGLFKLADLGEIWESETMLPVPLGGIVASRKLGEDVIRLIQHIIHDSVCYAINNPESSRGFVKSRAAETSDMVINQHIELYVNEFSRSLSDEGRRAILKLIGLTKSGELLTLQDILLPWETQ